MCSFRWYYRCRFIFFPASCGSVPNHSFKELTNNNKRLCLCSSSSPHLLKKPSAYSFNAASHLLCALWAQAGVLGLGCAVVLVQPANGGSAWQAFAPPFGPGATVVPRTPSLTRNLSCHGGGTCRGTGARLKNSFQFFLAFKKLRYNLHTIRCTHFKCIQGWVLVNLYSCVCLMFLIFLSITTIQF